MVVVHSHIACPPGPQPVPYWATQRAQYGLPKRDPFNFVMGPFKGPKWDTNMGLEWDPHGALLGPILGNPLETQPSKNPSGAMLVQDRAHLGPYRFLYGKPIGNPSPYKTQ